MIKVKLSEKYVSKRGARKKYESQKLVKQKLSDINLLKNFINLVFISVIILSSSCSHTNFNKKIIKFDNSKADRNISSLQKKNIEEIISFTEWTELLKISVSKIPELRALWKWQEKTGHHVYIGGGALRGLMQWLHKNLQNHSLEEVQKMKIPNIKELLILKGSDIDIFVPDNAIEALKRDLPEYASWDILGERFHEENVKLGGPTIEKVRANPSSWDDPLNGLKHYYEGKLVFHMTPENVFRDLYWVKERGNTKLSEALRFLRMENDLPELRATPESYKRISNIGKIEMKYIKKGTNNDWWIQKKGLAKLYKSTGNNFSETLDILRKRNLLWVVALKNYSIPAAPENKDLVNYFDNLKERGFSLKELKFVERMQVNQASGNKAIMSKTANWVQSTANFITISEFSTSSPSDAYKVKMNKFIRANLDTFSGTNPSIEQINKLSSTDQVSNLNIHTSLTNEALTLVRSSKDIIDIASNKKNDPTDSYYRAAHNFVETNINSFFRESPTISQVNQLIGLISNNSQLHSLILVKTLENMNLDEDAFRNLQFPAKKSKKLKKLLSDIFQENPSWRNIHKGKSCIKYFEIFQTVVDKVKGMLDPL